MYNDTYFQDDTIGSDFNKINVYRSYMFDRIVGVRNIRETGIKVGTDSIEESEAFLLDKKVYKIYTIAYLRDSIGKRTDMGKCLYYFANDSILCKKIYKIQIAPFEYKLHFEALANEFIIEN